MPEDKPNPNPRILSTPEEIEILRRPENRTNIERREDRNTEVWVIIALLAAIGIGIFLMLLTR